MTQIAHAELRSNKLLSSKTLPPLAKQSHTLYVNYPCVIDNNKEDTNLNFRWSLLTICISPASYIVSTIAHQR